MDILTYPNDALRKVSKAVVKVTPELAEIAKEMYKVMIDAKGVGLAANQVGLEIRLIVLDDGGKPLYMFNPVILHRSSDVTYENEGCLSFPGDWKKIKRVKKVKVKYRNVNNKMEYREFEGLLAVAVQHEIEHLNGILFIDHEPVKEQNEKEN